MSTTAIEFPGPRDRSCPLDPPPGLMEHARSAPLIRVHSWGGDAWLITGYEEAKAVFASKSFSANPTAPGYPEKSAGYAASISSSNNFRTMDDPEHQKQKRMVMDDFTVKRVEAMRPKLEAIVKDRIDEMLKCEPPVDLVAALALPVPLTVICELVGVPYEDRDFFGHAARVCFSAVATPEEAQAATKEVDRYLDQVIDRKDADPQDDLVSRLVVRQLREGILTRAQVKQFVMLMLLAGHETTANAISLSVTAMCTIPGLLDELRALASGAERMRGIDELFRYLSPTHLGRRRACIEDFEVGGVVIRAGEGVIIANHIADRDPTVFANPDEIDLGRENAGDSVAFGWGTHQCPGRYLSRVELDIVHTMLWDRIPTLRLAAAPMDLEFKENATVYGLNTLPVTWDTE